MIHVKKFKEINETFFYYSDYVDLDLLQGVIERMRPGKNNNRENFKENLKIFNEEYSVTQHKRLPDGLEKQVAWWIDLDLIQDVIDRMNPVLCEDSETYKIDLKHFIEE
jgi:hypothetical protein